MKTEAVPAVAIEAIGTLSDLPEACEAVIAANPDRKSREMGLAPGAHLRLLRNRRYDHAVVAALGDARFLVSRGVATKIMVKQSRTAAEAG
jgi:Fe2+ transport system protein FeoA